MTEEFYQWVKHRSWFWRLYDCATRRDWTLDQAVNEAVHSMILEWEIEDGIMPESELAARGRRPDRVLQEDRGGSGAREADCGIGPGSVASGGLSTDGHD